MQKRLFGAVAVIFLMSCSVEPGGETTVDTSPPNIILVITDDQGWAQLGIHGDDVLETPSIDALARESVEFDRFYVSPVCAPTRASLMTGRYSYRTGVVDTYLGRARMASDEVTLAEILREAGYRTGIFGKWHLGDTYPLRPQDQGFDEAIVHKGGGIGQPSDPPGSDYFDPILQHNGEQRQFFGYCTDVYFNETIRFIEETRDKPYFAYVATNAPHSPYLVPEEYREHYAIKGLNDKDARIYGMIDNIDDNVGRLLVKLDELGDTKNTIFIFMTDNGPTTRRFDAGLRSEKGTVYDGGIRVPFFLRWPEVLPARKVETIGSHIDIVPTLTEAAGASLPEGVHIDGRSLMPLLRGEDGNWPERTIYLQSHRGDAPELYRAFAAVSQRYKLTQPLSFSDPPPENATFELYDLEADYGEQTDIASELPDIVDRMKKAYEAWFEDVSSTRGYDGIEIFVGSEKENPVWLTRQDWRSIGEDNWGPGGLGAWDLDVRSEGRFDIRVHFREPATAPGRVEFAMAGVERVANFDSGSDSVLFEAVQIAKGKTILESQIVSGSDVEGAWFIEVEKKN